MDNKDFSLALTVPLVWIGSLLLFLIFTLLSPFLFLVSLFVNVGFEELVRLFLDALFALLNT